MPSGAGGPPKATTPKSRSWAAPVDFPGQLEPLPAPDAFIESARAFGVEFEPADLERLGRYLGLLLGANAVVNLTAVKDAEEAWTRHILDAMTLMPVLAEAEVAGDAGLRVLDVGTGGGLPGLALACVLPEVSFTLLDATEKKCAFCRHASRELGLERVRVVHARAEGAAHDRGVRHDSGGVSRREGAMRGAFDVVVSRAVGRLATLAELTVPFARVGGLCALVKGAKAEEELIEAKAALHMLHATHAGTIETPTGRIVVLEKRRETPRLYPRGNGEPKRKPLGVDASGAGGVGGVESVDDRDEGAERGDA